MDMRIFGKELTNVLQSDHNRYKRNYSYLQAEKGRDHSLNVKTQVGQRIINKSQVMKVETQVIKVQTQTIKIVETQGKVEAQGKVESKPKQGLEINDCQMVPQYFIECLQFIRNQEKQTYKLKNYLPSHETVKDCQRGKLIDWMSELHFKFKMFPETFFTIVNILDRYLSIKNVPIHQLQLVGVASFFIAAKYEETYQVPQLKQLVSCCAHLYTAAQILQKEADIVRELNFELIVNSAYRFFEPLAKAMKLQAKNRFLAQYVLELSLLQSKFLNYTPSLLASSAIYLIKKIRKSQSSWSDLMTSLVGYQECQLKSCAKDLCNLLENVSELQNINATRKKFSLPSFHEVTKIKLERKEKK